jgi:hypothetical protein
VITVCDDAAEACRASRSWRIGRRPTRPDSKARKLKTYKHFWKVARAALPTHRPVLRFADQKLGPATPGAGHPRHHLAGKRLLTPPLRRLRQVAPLDRTGEVVDPVRDEVAVEQERDVSQSSAGVPRPRRILRTVDPRVWGFKHVVEYPPEATELVIQCRAFLAWPRGARDSPKPLVAVRRDGALKMLCIAPQYPCYKVRNFGLLSLP